MADNNTLDELDQLAEQIGAAGAAEDGAVGVLAKAVSDLGSGVTDALKDALAVLRLEKGAPSYSTGAGDTAKPTPAHEKGQSEPSGSTYTHAKGGGMLKGDEEIADDHLENDRGGEEDSAPGDSPDEDEGGAGYEDMEMGGDLLDVTEFVASMARDNRILRKAVTAQGRLLRELAKDVKANRSLTTTVLQTQVATVAPLAKATQELLDAVSQIPEPSRFGGRPTRRALDRHQVTSTIPAAPGSFLGGDQVSERRILAKGMQKGVISEIMMSRYNRTRKFADNDQTHEAIVTQLQQLSA
jgi:hypothetical protein